MALARLASFLIVQTIVALFLYQNSPLTMATQARVATSPWADGPMRLVTTPQFAATRDGGEPKTDLFTTGATHMALLHNSIIRGFNSIYLQAPLVQDADKAAFVGYARTWFRFVKSHHDDEEENLFAKVEEILGDDKIWAETHDEHESFLGGLGEFDTYLASLPSATALSGTELVRIMDTFKEAFEHHFHHEIPIIASLASHPKAPKEGTPEAASASALFKAWGKKTVTKAGTWDVVPFFLLNLDRTAEGGLWQNWPPMPAPIRWGLVNIAGSWYGSWWRFASCDGQGRPRELYALQFRGAGGDGVPRDEL